RLEFQAVLGVVRGLLQREVVTALDRAQAEEGDAELAVAELPPGRRVRLVILEDRLAQLNAPGLQREQQRFQVFDPVLELDLAHSLPPCSPARNPSRAGGHQATQPAGSQDFVTGHPRQVIYLWPSGSGMLATWARGGHAGSVQVPGRGAGAGGRWRALAGDTLISGGRGARFLNGAVRRCRTGRRCPAGWCPGSALRRRADLGRPAHLASRPGPAAGRAGI